MMAVESRVTGAAGVLARAKKTKDQGEGEEVSQGGKQRSAALGFRGTGKKKKKKKKKEKKKKKKRKNATGTKIKDAFEGYAVDVTKRTTGG